MTKKETFLKGNYPWPDQHKWCGCPECGECTCSYCKQQDAKYHKKKVDLLTIPIPKGLVDIFKDPKNIPPNCGPKEFSLSPRAKNYAHDNKKKDLK